MYPNTGKKNVNSAAVPSEQQAREKLAVYVYEYLVHVGAQKAAETFLQEMRWNKQIGVSEPPGFLQSWWCVFWDLYCAAPERRESHEHSSEAKAFHDYGFVPSSAYPTVNGINTQNAAPSPLPPMPAGHPMPQSDGHPGGGFYPAGIPPQYSNRYSSPRPGGVRMQVMQDPPFSAGQPVFSDQMAIRGGNMIPQQRLAANGPQQHHRMPSMNHNFAQMRPSRPPWLPGTMSNGPSSTPGMALSSPQSQQNLTDSGQAENMYLRQGQYPMTSEGGVPVSLSEMMMQNGGAGQGQVGPEMEFKNSPGGSIGGGGQGGATAGTPGPGSVPPPSCSQSSNDPNQLPSSDYLNSHPFQPSSHEVPGEHTSASENEAIMQIKNAVAKEAEQFEKGPPAGSDFMY